MDEAGDGRAAGDDPDTSERGRLIHNEQTKLTATTINGVALAFIVGGGVATITGLGTIFGVGDQFARAAIWLMGGVVLHFAARRHLRTLR